ncbi:MAG: division/cell wall cluster transcriptional repressor MraZ [Bacteroidota bacterium]|nr:division/cell wall cluster transcriptional repressor MraZ [Bacteroidota bacterium]
MVKSGNNWLFNVVLSTLERKVAFLGEHTVKIDAKGRMRLPGGLKQQMKPENKGRFVVNRGFESCLEIYPIDVWEKVRARIERLNQFKKKERSFIRYFMRGATEVVLDGQDRLNLPKHLLEYAGITGEAILTPGKNTLELWDSKRYEAELNISSDNFADLAEDVLGDLSVDE